MFNLPFFTVAVLLPFMCQSLPVQNKSIKQVLIKSSDQHVQKQLEQQEYACLLKRNSSLLNEFQLSVREKHGIADPKYNGRYSFVTATSMDGNVRCRDRNSCPGGEVIWCVNVYHPVENIEACFSDGKLVNATDAALNLNLPQYFDSQAAGGESNSLHVMMPPSYLSHSYLTCTVYDEGSDCSTKKTFHNMIVNIVNSEDIPPSITVFPSSAASTASLIIGETNVFYCAATTNSSTNPPFQYEGWWKINGTVKNNTIKEDPYCNPANDSECLEDRTNSRLKNNRIRFYTLSQKESGCPTPINIISNWMWIDDAREEDAYLDISCHASFIAFPSNIIENSVNLRLQPVYNSTLDN